MLTRRDQLGHKAKKKEAEPRGNRGRGKARGSGGRGRGGRGRGRQGAGKEDDSEHEEEGATGSKPNKTRKSSIPKTSDSEPKAKKVKQVKEGGGDEAPPRVLRRIQSKTSVAEVAEDTNATKKRSRVEKTTSTADQEIKEKKKTKKPKKAKEVEPEIKEVEPEIKEVAASSRKKKQAPSSGSRAQDADAVASSSRSSRPRKTQKTSGKAEKSEEVNGEELVRGKAFGLENWTECINYKTLEFDELKFYTKELLASQLPESPHMALNIYWKRSSCGVKIREGDITTKLKDAFYFSCPKDANVSESLKMLLSIGAARGMVSRWLTIKQHNSYHLCFFLFKPDHCGETVRYITYIAYSGLKPIPSDSQGSLHPPWEGERWVFARRHAECTAGVHGV